MASDIRMRRQEYTDDETDARHDVEIDPSRSDGEEFIESQSTTLPSSPLATPPSADEKDGRSLSKDVKRQLFVLGLFPFSEHVAWASTFPYIYNMVRGLLATSSSSTDDPGATANVAFYAGVLVSVFTFGEFLMAPVWAGLSDRLGRKATLLLGSVGAVGSAAGFGLARNLWIAIVLRLVAGGLNPNLGVLRTYVGELVDRRGQARGFSTIAFMRSLGSITGPVIGGYLADPVRSMPSIFNPGTVWDVFPYLLPNLFVCTCLIISCILGFIFLKEVHPHFRDQEDLSQRLYRSLRKALHRGSPRGDVSIDYLPLRTDEELDLDTESRQQQQQQQLSTGSDTKLTTSQSSFTKFKYRDAFTNQVILQIVSSTFNGFRIIGTLALVPIYLGTPQPTQSQSSSRLAGGFGLTTSQTSNVLLLQALSSILSQIFLVPQTINRLGVLPSYRLALLTSTAIYLLMPWCLLLPSPQAAMTSFIILMAAYAYANSVSGTCSAMLITNAAPRREYMATINGVETSASCLARTAGPAVLGALVKVGLAWGNVGVVPFGVLAGVGGVGWGLSWTLRDG